MTKEEKKQSTLHDLAEAIQELAELEKRIDNRENNKKP